jgi:DNA invertase Pin-like site-specific DNA recombinase
MRHDQPIKKDEPPMHAAPATITPQSPTVCYVRVSTSDQNTDAQIAACRAYASMRHLTPTNTYRDTESGAKPWRLRALAGALDQRPPPRALIAYEFSRIGRDMLDTLDCLKTCAERQIEVHIVKSGQVLHAGTSGKIIATIMALAAEIERDLLRSRTQDAMQNIKRNLAENGTHTTKAGRVITALGRPKGSVSESKIASHAADVARLTAAGVSRRAIARLLDCDHRTVQRLQERQNHAQS